MGVKLQRPGEPGHPGGNRKTYVRVNYQGLRRTRVFNSAKAAQDYADELEGLLKAKKTGEFLGRLDPSGPVPAPPAPTFREAADHWWGLESPRFKHGTLDTFRTILDRHLLPAFGDRRLDALTPADVEAWCVRVRAAGWSHGYVARLRLVLVAILRRAVMGGHIIRNPADTIQGPLGREDRERRQAEWLTEPELRGVLKAGEQHAPRYAPALLTIASTGLRLGEGLGLQVGDADLPGRRLYIRRQVRKFKVGSPKSGHARTVALPPATVDVLRGWLEVVRAEAAVRGQEPLWLFPSLEGGPLHADRLRNALRKALRAAGVRRHVTVHHLRHTYASLALQRGVPILVVSRQLGHSSVAVTSAVYGHLAPDATQEAAAAWQAILDGAIRNRGATPAGEGREALETSEGGSSGKSERALQGGGRLAGLEEAAADVLVRLQDQVEGEPFLQREDGDLRAAELDDDLGRLAVPQALEGAPEVAQDNGVAGGHHLHLQARVPGGRRQGEAVRVGQHGRTAPGDPLHQRLELALRIAGHHAAAAWGMSARRTAMSLEIPSSSMVIP